MQRDGCDCHIDPFLPPDVSTQLWALMPYNMWWVDAAVVLEVSLRLGLLGEWPRDAIFITSLVISVVRELMVVFE